MKNSWPKLTCSVERKIYALHELPGSIGNFKQHGHDYLIRAGWTHEVNPMKGVTKPMQAWRAELDEILDLLDRRDLNMAMEPWTPTAENLACWIMARLPSYWQFVEIECYEGFRVRITADSMRSEWAAQFLGGPA